MKADHTTGRTAEYPAIKLREAARRPDASGAAPYVSRAEVLTQCDLEQVTEQVNFPVRILLRGPLMVRTRNVMTGLEQILLTPPPFVGGIPQGSAPLPVPPSDFSRMASLFQSQDVYPSLLTVRGCTGCLTLGDDATAGLCLEHSRFDDLGLAAGCEATIANGIARGSAHSSHASCGPMGSIISELFGVDHIGIQENLAEWGVPVLRFSCIGSEPAPVGADWALRNLVTWRHPKECDNRGISIPDYSNLALGSRRPSCLGAEALTTQGYQVCVWGGEGFGDREFWPAPVLNWVVMAEGLGATWQMEVDCGIPYFCGLPLEHYGLKRWPFRFSMTVKGTSLGKPAEHETGNHILLLIGAPTATKGLVWAIRGECPSCRILRAFYVPYRILRELYRPLLAVDALLFGDPARLAAWATPNVLLADPLFFLSLRPWFPRAEFPACPEPGMCGRGGLPVRWLGDVACMMLAIGKSHTW